MSLWCGYRVWWVPLPASFSFFNVILSLCTLKDLPSAQTDILCSGKEGQIVEEEEKVKWVTTGCLKMSRKRRKLFFFVVDGYCSLSSPVRTINMGFSSRLVLKSFMIIWLFLKAAPSKRRMHYETKVREKTSRDVFRFTSWRTESLSSLTTSVLNLVQV